MKTQIEVKNRDEARMIKAALDDPPTRALVKIIGALLPLNDRGRMRVLNYVDDVLEERRKQ